MLIVWAVLMIVFVMTAPAAAEEMSPNQAHRFVVGKLFEVSCFDGTRAIGRIDGDGTVIGSIQFRGTARSVGPGCRQALENQRRGGMCIAQGHPLRALLQARPNQRS